MHDIVILQEVFAMHCTNLEPMHCNTGGVSTNAAIDPPRQQTPGPWTLLNRKILIKQRVNLIKSKRWLGLQILIASEPLERGGIRRIAFIGHICTCI